MALPILPNPSNFLAVALVINRTRDGPRFVFHYPANVLPVQERTARDSNEDDLDDDDIFADRVPRPSELGNTGGSSLPNAEELASWNQDDHLITEGGTQIVPWEHVAGFPTKALEAILTPARAYHKTLFQVSLDPIYCVSYPIYVPKNGIWKKKKKPPKSKTPKGEDEDAAMPQDTDAVNRQNSAGPSSVRASDVDNVDVRDMAKPTKSGAEEDANAADAGGGDKEKLSSMTMFNLVFILNPKKEEVRELVDVMYTHIIKKVNKAYKYCQQRSDFVWKESKKILALKDKAREDRRKMSSLWSEILATSSLAASMQDVYEAVSQNKIATLQLDTAYGTVTHSVQIPIPFHLSDLPQENEEAARGLWITTANSFVQDDALDDEPAYLDKNFALLLMDDEKQIVAELQADPDETTLAMVEFVKHSKPTLSFHQVAQQPNNILTLGQVRKYAQHFIFWRRGIAIPPLHARDIYILSPNCDLSKLPRAAADWGRTFPFAPALPDFLANLSAVPRSYKSFCPSKSHRPDYIRMLAWLMRGGWVCQLCTFAYVVVWPEILYEVEYALEADELARAKRAQQAAVDELETGPKSSQNGNSSTEDEGMGSSAATLKGSAAGGGGAGAGSGSSRPSASELSDDENSSLSTSHASSSSPVSSFKDAAAGGAGSDGNNNHHHHHETTPAQKAAERARLERIAEKAARELAEKATAHARKVLPTQTDHPSINEAAHLAHLAPHIILDAKKPTGKESLYLSAIGRRLRQRRAPPPPASKKAVAAAAAAAAGGGERERDRGREAEAWAARVADAWPLFWKYFNGRSALERVALMEDMKRKEVWNLLTAMSEHLLCVRHW